MPSCPRPLCTFLFLRIIRDGICGTSRPHKAPDCPGDLPLIFQFMVPQIQGLYPCFSVVFFRVKTNYLFKAVVKCTQYPASTPVMHYRSPITWTEKRESFHIPSTLYSFHHQVYVVLLSKYISPIPSFFFFTI